MDSKKFATLVVLASLCVPAPAADWMLRVDGIGPLRIGMRFDEANERVGKVLRRTEPALRASEGCDQLALKTHPGIQLMFIGDVLARVDVAAAGTRTDHGIAVGDPVARVLKAYPRIQAEPNKYDASEQYLTALSADGKLAIRFETRRGKVGQFYAGAFEQVQYVEGCL